MAGGREIHQNLLNLLALQMSTEDLRPEGTPDLGREEITHQAVLLLILAQAQVGLGLLIGLEEGKNMLGDTGGSEFPLSCPPY